METRTCRSNFVADYHPVDITFIVGGRAFDKWGLTLKDKNSGKVLKVVGEHRRGDFQTGYLTDEAVSRMAMGVGEWLNENSPFDEYTINLQEVMDYLKRY